MKVLIIDNYDSFTYNLQHYAEQFAEEVTVLRNDAISLEQVVEYSHIIISPGPGLPADAGITLPLLERYHHEKSILGVCLGCQAMAVWSGGQLYNQQWVAHGIARTVKVLGDGGKLLQGMPASFASGLYHSWAIDRQSLSPQWQVTAENEHGTLMAMEHRQYQLYGVQFHPESIMTESGLSIVENWLKA